MTDLLFRRYLKSVVSTIFDLKLPVLGLLMLLLCVTACNQHEVLPTETPTESFETLNLSDDETAFFSDDNMIQSRSLDNELNREDRLFFHRAIQQMKHFMQRMNLQMEHKYIPHIAQNVGQPAWLAGYVIGLENGRSLTFIPIVEDSSEKVAGVISFYKGENNESAYSLTTRHQIEVATEDDYDPNYNFLTQMFYEFDKQLFAYEGEEYTEWAGRRWWGYPYYYDLDCYETLNCLGALRTSSTNRIFHRFDGTAFDTTPFTDLGSLSDLCFVYCSSGCSDGVYDAGIVDTAEEASWLSGSCGYANILDDFLEENNEPEIGQILLDAAILGYLTFTELRALANAIDAYLSDPDNATADAACVVQEVLNGLEAISPSTVDLMNQAYVADVYSLSASFPVADIESELLADLVYLYCSQLVIDACTGLPISTSTITNILVNSANTSNPNTSYSDFYAELSVYDYIDTGILSQFTLDGNPFDYSELPTFCNDSTLPDCTGCSVGQQQAAQSAYLEARNKLECAIHMLNEYDGSTGDVFVHLATHFNSTDKGLAKFISSLLTYVKIASTGVNFTLQNTGEGLCDGNYAWSFPIIHFTDIRLCYPEFWNASLNTQSTVLIHEYMHLYFLAGDIAYMSDPRYPNLSTTQSIFNADSYLGLVGSMCP